MITKYEVILGVGGGGGGAHPRKDLGVCFIYSYCRAGAFYGGVFSKFFGISTYALISY